MSNYRKALCISLKANSSSTMPKIWRTVRPFSFSAMMRDPSCPPAKEKIAAVRINLQSVSAREMWVIKPLHDEKTTMKMEVAAAVLVGTFRT